MKKTLLSAQDRQEQVQKAAEWPNSTHGLFTIKFGKNICWGTGVMTGPNIVLTAAHNLNDYQLETYTDLVSMRFSPGVNDDDQALFGSVEVGECFISLLCIKEGKEDYGILVLKEPIGKLIGYLGLVCLEPEEIKQKRITLPGGSHEISETEATPSFLSQEEGSTVR